MATTKVPLAPCPFCGGEAEIDSFDRTDDSDVIIGYDMRLSCDNSECRVKPSIFGSTEEWDAILDAWNTRADHADLLVECEKAIGMVRETVPMTQASEERWESLHRRLSKAVTSTPK